MMDFLVTKQRQQREHEDADAAAEKPAIHGDNELKDDPGDKRPRMLRPVDIEMDHAAQRDGEMPAENEDERRGEQQPREKKFKGGVRRLEQKLRADESADQARDQENGERAPLAAQLAPVGADARQRAEPKRQGVGRVGADRRDAAKHERGKSEETPAARDRIDRPGDDRRQAQGDRAVPGERRSQGGMGDSVGGNGRHPKHPRRPRPFGK